ncbi:hypothetical protein B0H11DRAFT_1907204 [Mycena galericulata]|nr:hypothetical protein B0H11DRAFT_1907204 [Mycena galericulata]
MFHPEFLEDATLWTRGPAPALRSVNARKQLRDFFPGSRTFTLFPSDKAGDLSNEFSCEPAICAIEIQRINDAQYSTFFKRGTRIFFWDVKGQAVRATVERVLPTPDGTLFLQVRDDGGRTITVPASAVTKLAPGN